MNTNQIASRRKRTRFWFWFLLPLSISICALAWIAMQEFLAARSVRQTFENLRAAGLPVDDETSEARFIATTSQRYTVEWNEISNLLEAQGNLADRLPYLSNDAKSPLTLGPDEPWEKFEYAKDYLDRIQPVIERMIELSQEAGPVWQPIEFNGYGTLLEPLQQSTQLLRNLALYFDFADFNEDRARAMRDLRAMKAVSDAFNWEMFTVCKFIHNALELQRWNAIQRSLARDFWEAEDMDQLIEVVGPPDLIQTTWPAMVDADRAVALAMFKSGEGLDGRDSMRGQFDSFVFSVPSLQKQYLAIMAEYRQVAADGFKGLAQRADELRPHGEEASEGILGAGLEMLLPAPTNMADAFIGVENQRRLTRTAVAVKQFQLLHGNWPGNLTALESPEIAGGKFLGDDWVTVNEGPLGYVLSDDSSDAKVARVLIADPRGNVPFATSLPTMSVLFGDEERSISSCVAVEIR